VLFRSVFPMYHPAAALHQASLRETLFIDISALPQALLEARGVLEAERAASVREATRDATAPAQAPAVEAADQLTLFQEQT